VPPPQRCREPAVLCCCAAGNGTSLCRAVHGGRGGAASAPKCPHTHSCPGELVWWTPRLATARAGARRGSTQTIDDTRKGARAVPRTLWRDWRGGRSKLNLLVLLSTPAAARGQQGVAGYALLQIASLQPSRHIHGCNIAAQARQWPSWALSPP